MGGGSCSGASSTRIEIERVKRLRRGRESSFLVLCSRDNPCWVWREVRMTAEGYEAIESSERKRVHGLADQVRGQRARRCATALNAAVNLPEVADRPGASAARFVEQRHRCQA